MSRIGFCSAALTLVFSFCLSFSLFAADLPADFDSRVSLLDSYLKQGELEKAVQVSDSLFADFPARKEDKALLEAASAANMALLTSKKPSFGFGTYTVKRGDSLAKIAKKYHMTPEFLARINGIKKNIIHPKQKLKVLTGRFSVLVDKSACTLDLFVDGKFVKRYMVSTGKSNSSPVGVFKVTSKLVEPVWYRPEGGVIPYGDPDNLIGTRWLGINSPGYGIHGTWEPESIGSQASAGCIRLLNSEVEELYTILTRGDKVEIVD